MFSALPTGDAALDEKRLQELVAYSAQLRPQMVLAAAFIAAVVWIGGGTTASALAWLALVVATREVRAAWLLRLRADTATPIAARLERVVWLSLALGAAYGSVAVFVPRIDIEYDAIVTMLLLSLGAGAITTTFTVVPAFVAFGVGLTVPSAVAWALTNGWPGLGLAVLLLLFLNFQIRFARRTYDMFVQGWRMGRHNDQLVAQLSEERGHLRSARDAAVAADVAKSRFLASASHDLRQPLQSLVLNAGALARRPLDAATRAIADDVNESVVALGHMLDGLLDVSQLDAGAVNVELRSLRLHRLLVGVCQRFEGAARAKGLDLRCTCPAGLMVISDAQMLQRVVSNLVDNALKFTPHGRVSVDAVDLGSRVRVTVSDTGVGIAPTDRHRVFDDLVQLDNPQRDRARGHGLGLGIVRRLSRLIGAEVILESEVDAGTQVHLDLPPAHDESPVVGDAGEPHPGLIARRVLVLDDDEAVRKAYAAALTTLGCDVRSAGTVDQALDVLATFDAEVALVDYRLGGDHDGIAASRLLRARSPGVLAVLVSADTGSELRHLAAREGLPTLRKPVSDALLALTINRLLSDPAATVAAPWTDA